MKKIRKSILLLALLLAMTINTGILAEERTPDDYDKLVQEYAPTGAAVVLIHNGEIAEVRNYGLASLEKGRAVDNNTAFRIASISKPMTAYAVMRLVDEGRLDLDAPVDRYLTRWRLPASEFDNSKVTLRRLMTHTSGVSDSSEDGYTEPLPDIAAALAQRDIHLIQEPGTVYSYSSNSGFGICQLVIEEVTGQKFEDYMAQHVFKPLGMKNASYAHSDPNLATPYVGTDPLPVSPIVMNGADGATATATDLANFAIGLMEYCNAAQSEMFKVQPNTQNPEGEYCLGLMSRALSDGRRIYEHGGCIAGWNSRFVFEPESGNGLVVMTNSDKGFAVTPSMGEKWSQNILGEALTNPFNEMLVQWTNIAAIAVGAVAALWVLLLVIGLARRSLHVKKGRYGGTIGVIISALAFMVLWYGIFYTNVPKTVLAQLMPNTVLDCFPLSGYLPSALGIINIEVAALWIIALIRSRLTRKSIQRGS